jgi:hypothetical protein
MRGKVFEQPAESDRQLRRIAHVVEGGACHGPAAVDGIEVEGRGTPVRRREGIRRLAERGRSVERDVMVDELPHEGRAGRMARVVLIVGAEIRVRDQLLRSGAELVLGVEETALCPERDQCLAHAL